MTFPALLPPERPEDRMKLTMAPAVFPQGTPLPAGRWSYQHERCVQCGTTEREHEGHGYCTRCYWRRAHALRKQAA